MSAVAKLGDRVIAVDTHIVLTPSPGGPLPTPTPLPFDGKLVENLCPTVLADNRPIATNGSVAINTQPHLPPSGAFQTPPSNRGRIRCGSPTVRAGGKPVAREEDTVDTCNDPHDAPQGQIIAQSTVRVG
jgi:uncharacterized Zn-binding protein involved in type VI secretion